MQPFDCGPVVRGIDHQISAVRGSNGDATPKQVRSCGHGRRTEAFTSDRFRPKGDLGPNPIKPDPSSGKRAVKHAASGLPFSYDSFGPADRIFSSAWSTVNGPVLCRGGNSRKVSRKRPKQLRQQAVVLNPATHLNWAVGRCADGAKKQRHCVEIQAVAVRGRPLDFGPPPSPVTDCEKLVSGIPRPNGFAPALTRSSTFRATTGCHRRFSSVTPVRI